MVDKSFIDREHPQQEADKERKEYYKRDHRPDGDVVDALKNVFIHSGKIIQVFVRLFYQL